MNEKTVTVAESRALARAPGNKLASQRAAPNPQGKGLVGFLLDWNYSSPREVTAKPQAQVLADYFTSLLVLSAKFKFKPTFGKNYYLYWDETCLSLSLISPKE